jgi:exodeoxyribonuclease VII small subunit
MADDPKKFDFTQSVNKLEEINTWFQNEDIDLDEGLYKLKAGKELIKKCRTRLKEVENEFIKIKKEFAEEAQEQEVEAVEDLHNRQRPKHQLPDDDGLDPDDTPF